MLDYDNLVYACSSCNHSKAAHLAPDPCKLWYGRCVTVDENGEIRSLNADGVTLIETLGLDDDDYNELRRAIFELLAELPPGGKAYCRLFGYPNNLPDLSKEPKPPGGNKGLSGLGESCFEKAKAGRLPRFY